MAILCRGLLVFLLLVLPFLTSCSGDQENKEKKEKNIIEQKTHEAAQQAVERIKVPLDQARSAAEQENIHKRRLEKQEEKR